MHIDRFRHLVAITGEGRQPIVIRTNIGTYEVLSVQLVYDYITGVEMWHIVGGERVRVTGVESER